MMHCVLVPVAEEQSEESDLSRQSIGTPAPISQLASAPVLSFDDAGPCEYSKYRVREAVGDVVRVETNRAVYFLPASMPVAVSGVVRLPEPDPRAVDTGIDLSAAHPSAGWVLASQLAWNDGLFWAPEFGSGVSGDTVEGDPNSAQSKPRLRWIELVHSVSPHVSEGPDSRLQVLTAPSYFVASGDQDSHGILVSGVATVSPLQALAEPDGQAQASTAKRRTKKTKTV